MEKRKYSAPYDNLVKVVSNGAVIILLLLLFNIVHNGLNSKTIGLGLIIPIVLVIWLIHPSGYLLDVDGLKIRRPIGSMIIPYENILNVNSVFKEDIGPYVRLFGCGGLFGYFGTYMSKSMGKFIMWCTNKDNMVIIEKKDESIILISPSDTDSFIEAINTNLRQIEGANA